MSEQITSYLSINDFVYRFGRPLSVGLIVGLIVDNIRAKPQDHIFIIYTGLNVLWGRVRFVKIEAGGSEVNANNKNLLSHK